MPSLRQAATLAVCAGGIYASYLTQGVVQEALAIKRFGPTRERFEGLKALNGVQSVACFAWAALLLALVARPAKGARLPPVTAFWKVGVTNSIGPALGIEALKNISYPAQARPRGAPASSDPARWWCRTCVRCARGCDQAARASRASVRTAERLRAGAQVLAKSCKMIPVMLMGTLIGGKFYSALEYACALMIAAGISLFARQSSSKVTSKLAAPNAPLGYALCLLNLVFDGYTNAAQVDPNPPARCTHRPCCLGYVVFDGYTNAAQVGPQAPRTHRPCCRGQGWSVARRRSGLVWGAAALCRRRRNLASPQDRSRRRCRLRQRTASPLRPVPARPRARAGRDLQALRGHERAVDDVLDELLVRRVQPGVPVWRDVVRLGARRLLPTLPGGARAAGPPTRSLWTAGPLSLVDA
jgi:hypothetical protein